MKNNSLFGKHWLRLSLIAILFIISSTLSAQVYNNIVTYATESTPTYGMKIKTKIPFLARANASSALIMPIVNIKGYIYGDFKTIDLSLSWYRLGDKFYSVSVASNGSANPKVFLTVENGFVLIYMDQKSYCQRFAVSLFLPGAKPEHSEGWTIVDEPKTGTNELEVIYKNNFGGRVGIGTDNPQALLDVRGKIIADEVEIKVNKGADFVFNPDYSLKPLSEVEAFIAENNHLPEIQSEKDMQENGLNINEFQIKLLQKIEELTLYTIEQNKTQLLQEERLKKQEEIIKDLQNKVNKK